MAVRTLSGALSIVSMHISFSENPLIFTQVIVGKWKYRQTDNRQMDRHRDDQREIIIPCHYHTFTPEKVLIYPNFHITAAIELL